MERIEELPAIRMVWQEEVNGEDLRNAFHDIVAHLDSSDTPLYVIVDIDHNPKFPVAETVVHALAGPFRHQMLAEWLVIGSSSAARTIENLLSRVTGRSNVRWFDSEVAALAFLASDETIH